MLHDGAQALVVDPGDAEPVLRTLQTQGLQLAAILVTHHHGDHTGGIAMLKERTGATVYGTGGEGIDGIDHALAGGETLSLLGQSIQVIATPGHTRAHIAFWLSMQGQAGQSPILFCGDTLFSAGCGRLFEGTATQMYQSLITLAAFPGNTRVCCAHEYTLANLRFAQAVEPDNAAIATHRQYCEDQRNAGLPTLPSTLEQERTFNPYLRCQQATVRTAAQTHDPKAQSDIEVFAALRQWKNVFA